MIAESGAALAMMGKEQKAFGALPSLPLLVPEKTL